MKNKITKLPGAVESIFGSLKKAPTTSAKSATPKANVSKRGPYERKYK